MRFFSPAPISRPIFLARIVLPFAIPRVVVIFFPCISNAVVVINSFIIIIYPFFFLFYLLLFCKELMRFRLLLGLGRGLLRGFLLKLQFQGLFQLFLKVQALLSF